MIKNGTYVLKQNVTIEGDFKLLKDQEIGVSNNVIYMGGQLLDTRLQKMIVSWMENNLALFIVDNRF